MSQAPITRRKLYQEVQERLLQRINAGEIRPGEQLPSERELMEFYGVGRVAVREALQELARSGIVEISHGERARVVVPTARLLIQQMAEGTRHLLRMQPEMLDHMKDARLFLETGMVRLAAQRATPEDVVALRERWQRHHDAMQDLEHFIERDMQFHREIARISGNPIFPAIVEAMFGWADEYYRSIVRAPGVESVTLAEHERIVQAIEQRDPDAAERAMRDHLTRVSELYRRVPEPS
jgi:DNA-binding FadR family transcriptional regulator